MFQNLIDRIQGFIPTILSAYQTAPWLFWAIGGLLVTIVVYMATLPRRRREFLRKNFHFYNRRANEGDWRFATVPFPGKINFNRFRLSVISFTYKGEERNMTDIQTISRGETPHGIGSWNRDWSDQEGIDWLVVKIQQPRHRRSRKLFVIAGVVLIISLIGWFVVKPAFEQRGENERSAEVIETPVSPTMPAPLACDEDSNCVGQGFTAIDSTPEPAESQEVDFNSSSLIIDLDQEARRTPSEIENRLIDWLSQLPAGPVIEIPFLDPLVDLLEEIFNSGGTATLISVGEDGFILVSYAHEYLKYQYLNEQVEPIGDTITVWDNCGTVLAGKEEILRWGVCISDEGEWKISRWGKGGYNIWAFEGGVIIDPSLKGTVHRFNPFWFLALLPIAVLGLIWLRRR